MFEFNNNAMKKHVGSVMFQRGMNIYLRGEVRKIDFERRESEDIITGTVQDLSSSEKNTVEILLDNNTGEIKFNCNCYDFKSCITTGKKIKPCKHIVAVSLRHFNGLPEVQCKAEEMRRERNRTKSSSDRYSAIVIPLTTETHSVSTQDSVATNLLNELENFQYIKHLEKINLNLIINFEIEEDNMPRSFVELKIGENCNYEVSNVETFLKSVKYKNIAIKYGNNFLFNPKTCYFSSMHQQILDLFIEIYETFSFANNYTSVKLIYGKRIYLSDNYLKRLFKLLENENISASVNSENLNVNILKEDLPLMFNITEKHSKVYIAHTHSLPIPLTKDNEYFFFDKSIYKPSSKQIEIYRYFYDALLQFEGLHIKIDEIYMKEIVRYTLPTLKTISKSVILSETIDISKFLEPLELTACLILKDDFLNEEIKENLSLNESNNYTVIVVINSLEDKRIIENMLLDSGFEKKNNKFVLQEEEKLLYFLTNSIEELENYGHVIFSEKLKNLKIYKYSNFKLHIDLNSKNLIEMYFTMNGIIVKNSKNILTAIKQGKSCYRIYEDELIYFDDRNFSAMEAFIAYFNDYNISIRCSELQLFKYKAVQIEQYILNHKIECVKINTKFKEFVRQIHMNHDIDNSLIQSVNNIVSSNCEIKGFSFIKKMAMLQCGGIITDKEDKMREVIAFISSEVEEYPIERKKTILITNLVLMDIWENTFQALSPNLNIIVLRGNRNDPSEFTKDISKADVVITTIENTEKRIYDFKDIFAYCFLEEDCFYSSAVRYLKNLNSELYFALTTKNISVKDDLRELWAVFNLVLPIYLDSENKFIEKYDCDKNEDLILELEESISPFILRNSR